MTTPDRGDMWVRGEIDDETYFREARAAARRRVRQPGRFGAPLLWPVTIPLAFLRWLVKR